MRLRKAQHLSKRGGIEFYTFARDEIETCEFDIAMCVIVMPGCCATQNFQSHIGKQSEN